MELGVFIQLTSVSPGVGPLVDIYSDADGYTTPFVTGFAVSMLLDGYWFNNLPLGSTTIKITSIGECTNSIFIPISNLPGCDTMFCAEMCCNFSLVNNSGSLRSWSYYDCEGTEQLGVYGDGDELRFCADQSIGSILVDNGCTLTIIGCCYECNCYLLIGEFPFTVKYKDCYDVEQVQISGFNGLQHIISYCGGAPTLTSGSFNETYILGNCYWDGSDYVCAP